MCDLWKNTLPGPVPAGAIPDQIDFALSQLRGMPPAGRLDPCQETQGRDIAWPAAGGKPHIKLYNSGSFFDPGAIPPQDYPAIAARMRGFERVIVECHPAFLGDRVLQFRDLLRTEADDARLEVAIGLETAHPGVLEKLNKGMTLEQFRRAAAFLRAAEVALRVFILVQPPFLNEAEGLVWANRSLDLAFEVGATVACLIPTRAGNGALEALASRGLFTPPRLTALEAAAEYGIRLGRAQVFVDLWDLERFSGCPSCFPARAERLRQMNLDQVIPGRIQCTACG